MMRRIGITAGALVLLAVTSVSAQQFVTGRVARVDQAAGVVVLDNGQMYQATPNTMFLVNNQPANWATLAPGTPVVVHNGQQVMYPDGRYVLATQQPATWPNSPHEISGVVRWVNPSSLTLDDGRHVWIDERTQVTAGGAPVMLSTLRPGTFVIIRSSQPMTMRKIAPIAYVPVAAPAPVVGTVSRFDQPNFIVLTDGRVIAVNANTVVIVNNQSVPVAMLQPGTPVVIYPNGAVAEYPSAMPAAIQQR
jgi:hypothetical protein